jgi:hypothetical protein
MVYRISYSTILWRQSILVTYGTNIYNNLYSTFIYYKINSSPIPAKLLTVQVKKYFRTFWGICMKVFAQLVDKFFLVMKGQERLKWSNIFGYWHKWTNSLWTCRSGTKDTGVASPEAGLVVLDRPPPPWPPLYLPILYIIIAWLRS